MLNSILIDFPVVIKEIWVSTTAGFYVDVTKVISDKMPICIIGADNESSTPVVIIARVPGGSNSYNQLSGEPRSVTYINNKKMLINGKIYSKYWVIGFKGSNFNLSNNT